MIDLNNSFVLKHQKEIHDASVLEFTESLSRLAGASLATKIANQIKHDIYLDYLNKTISNITSIQVEPNYLHDFFSQVYTSPLIDDCKFAIAFRSDEDIEKIRPEYLSSIVPDMGEMIRGLLDGRKKESDVKKLIITGEYENKLKKQLVKTTLVLNGTRDLLVLDSPPIVKIDKFFIQNNVLPFLSSYKSNTEELMIIAKKAIGRISELTNRMNGLFVSINKDIQSGTIPENKISLILYYAFNMKTITMRLCSYLTSMVIRKMAFYSFNITACMELYNSFSELFPEMEDILHESVMDGDLNDIDNDTLMQGVISGSLGAVRPHIQKVVGLKKLEISNAMCQKFNRKIDFISGFDINHEYPYNEIIYSDINKSFVDIIKNLHTFEIMSKDPEAVVDDIISGSNLSETFTTKYEKLISVISDISSYNVHGESGKISGSIMSLFNDLLNYEKNVGVIVYTMSKGYAYIDALMKSFDINNYGLNDTSYNELKSFLDTTMKNYKEYIIRIVRNLLERLDNITEALTFTEIVADGDTHYDKTNDYSLEAYAAAYDEFDTKSEVVFESLLMKYNQIKAMKERGVNLVYEADQNTTGNDKQNTKTEPTVKTDAQQQHNDNSSNNQQNTTTTNNNQTNNDQNKKGVLEKFKEFIDSILEKFRNKMNSLTNKNNKWLASVKQNIINLDMSKTTITLAPYTELVPETVINDIQAATTKINSLNASSLPAELKTSGSKAELFLFNKVPEKVGNEEGFPARIKKFYIYGNTDKTDLTSYSGDAAKTHVNDMIAYCEKYSTIAPQLSTALKKLSDAAYKKQSEINQAVNTNQNSNENKDNNTDTTVITSAVRDYSGAILTVFEKKYSDYIKVLSKLAPQNKTNGNNKPETDTNDEENNNENK